MPFDKGKVKTYRFPTRATPFQKGAQIPQLSVQVHLRLKWSISQGSTLCPHRCCWVMDSLLAELRPVLSAQFLAPAQSLA